MRHEALRETDSPPCFCGDLLPVLERLRQERDLLLAALMDVIAQACGDGDYLDHCDISAYRFALELLERLGEVVPVAGRLFRWREKE